MTSSRSGSSISRNRFRTLISADDVRQRRADCVLLDARWDLSDRGAARERYVAAHLPAARFVDLDGDLSGTPESGIAGRRPLPDPQEFGQLLGRLGVDGTQQVVVYDEGSGEMAAARAWLLMRWIGLEDVAVLDGGLRRWAAVGGDLESGEVDPEVVDFVPDVQLGWTATTEDVIDSLTDDSTLLIDGRTVDIYCGAVRGIDPDLGHIPGARCMPYSELTGTDGRMKPRADLRRQYEVIGAFDERVVDRIVYCGSGVWSALHVLAMTHAGVDGSRLYVGSWSEWTADAARPAQTNSTSLGGRTPRRWTSVA